MEQFKTVYTGGTFDLFHSGHVNFLRQCKKIGERVVVSLNTDEFIKKYKGKPPIMSYEERAEILWGCRYVDLVIPNTGGQDSKPAILQVYPDFIVIGSDWACKDYYAQMGFTQKWLDDYGIVLIYIPYTQGISTTEIKKRLA
jgi:glycerol-3-phosphate cytidylyltransferase